VSRRGLTTVGLALVAFALGCSSGGDDRSAETLTGSGTSATGDRDLAACGAIADSGEVRTCYAPPEDLVALIRQCDGFPGATSLA
jgi:hypothetical protein